MWTWKLFIRDLWNGAIMQHYFTIKANLMWDTSFHFIWLYYQWLFFCCELVGVPFARFSCTCNSEYSNNLSSKRDFEKKNSSSSRGAAPPKTTTTTDFDKLLVQQKNKQRGWYWRGRTMRICAHNKKTSEQYSGMFARIYVIYRFTAMNITFVICCSYSYFPSDLRRISHTHTYTPIVV